MELSTTYPSFERLKSDGKLLFLKSGDHYFLREILC